MIAAARFTTKSDLDDNCWDCGRSLTSETIYATPTQVLCMECLILLLKSQPSELEKAEKLNQK